MIWGTTNKKRREKIWAESKRTGYYDGGYDIWFAWYPVTLDDGRKAFWQKVKRIWRMQIYFPMAKIMAQKLFPHYEEI